MSVTVIWHRPELMPIRSFHVARQISLVEKGTYIAGQRVGYEVRNRVLINASLSR